jgi:hypothetical protein
MAFKNLWRNLSLSKDLLTILLINFFLMSQMNPLDIMGQHMNMFRVMAKGLDVIKFGVPG